jgi:hypothetical protein
VSRYGNRFKIGAASRNSPSQRIENAQLADAKNLSLVVTDSGSLKNGFHCEICLSLKLCLVRRNPDCA